MKRIKMILILMIPLLLTGCSSTLKCTIETNNYNSKVKIKFKDDKPITYKYKDEMKFSPTSADAEIYYHTKYSELSNLISSRNAHIGNNKASITIKVNYDFTKDKSDGEGNLLINRNDTKKEAIKKIESSGFTCK